LFLFCFFNNKKKQSSRNTLERAPETIRQIQIIRQIRKAPQATTDTN